MSLINELYNSNDSTTDFYVFKTVLPYLRGKINFQNTCLKEEKINFTEYEELSEKCKTIFRDLVYEQYKNPNYRIECTKQEFLELYNFLDFVLFNKKEFLPLFRRFIYLHRDDHDFLQKTASIHKNHKMLKISKKTLWFTLLNLPSFNNFPELETYIQKQEPLTNPDMIFYYAYNLKFRNSEKSEKMFLENWQKNRHSESLHEYATMLSCVPGNREKALRYFLEDWKENKNAESLHEYAESLILGNKADQKEGRETFLQNWKENLHPSSLNQYAFCLRTGIGGEKDFVEARKMYKINTEKNKHLLSMHDYAKFLEKGIGGEKDLEKAREIYFENWKENEYMCSLERYIEMLKDGIGGEKDLVKAEELISLRLSIYRNRYNTFDNSFLNQNKIYN